MNLIAEMEQIEYCESEGECMQLDWGSILAILVPIYFLAFFCVQKENKIRFQKMDEKITKLQEQLKEIGK